MSSLEQLGAFVAAYRPDEAAAAAVRLHAADTVGAWIAATRTPEGRALLAFRQDGATLTEHVAIHCALTRLSEVDDIHLGAMITPGSIVVPAVLTMAARLPDIDAEDVTAAIVAGYEAMVRLGAAIDGPSVLYRGIWPTYFAAPFGVAAAAARLMRFEAARTANALSAALIMASPGTGHHAAPTTVRWLAVGQAAARGFQAALAAGAGFTSDMGIADGELLKNIYGLAPALDVLGHGLGELALHQVSFKPWCAARQTMAATQALKEIVDEGIAPESIARVGVAVLPQHLRMIDHGVTPGDRFSHLTSVQYQMAVAALSPDLAFELSGPSGATPPALSNFMARIKVRAEESLAASGYPRSWAAHVTVTTANRRHEKTVTQVPGDPGLSFGEDDLRRKFARVTGLGAEAADAVFAFALDAAEKPAAALDEIERHAAREPDQSP
ncbi:MAG: MmgE/PrpD family protein [Alphaproteobacteria bacterium]|nr:MmgE/PrpD family protein [Alphaproteobacteria bacterium]